MKKRILSTLLTFCLVCCLLTGCKKTDLGKGSLEESESYQADASFEMLTNQWFTSQMSQDPLSCHFSVASPSSYGIAYEEESFSDISHQAFIISQKEQKSFQKNLKEIPYRELSARNQLVYDLLLDYYDSQDAMGSFYYYGNPLSPTSGIPASLPSLLAAFSFHSKEDISLYFHLLDDIDIYFEQLYCFAKEKNEKELLQNPNGLSDTITFCQDFSKYRPDHLLLSSFQDRMQACDFLDAHEKQKYISKNQTLLHDVVFPSYLSLSKKLSSLSINEDLGSSLCQLPNGHQYYKTLVAEATGCDDSPFLLYQRISKKRDADIKQMARLFSSHPSLTTSISNYQCPLTVPEDMIDILKRSIRTDYPSIPDVEVTIDNVSPQIAKFSAPAFYFIAPVDNFKQHLICYNPDSFRNSLDLFTTMAHEGFPGHLYQTCMSYAYGYEPVRCLLSYPGYVEGWATYVELDSFQHAGIPSQVAQTLSLNQSVILSLYASADIGVHFYGWDEERLLTFLKEYGISDKKVVSEIYQIILADPANYLKYYVGYLNFIDLREECQEKYPESFSPMNFHKAILKTGPSPFPILKREVFRYFDKSA